MDKVFLEKCTFFPQKTLSFDKKGLHNNMQPLFYLLFLFLILQESVFLLRGMLVHFQHRLTEQEP